MPGGGCAVLKDRGGVVPHLSVALARGKHLFPFRTEQLSPSAPMVLGSQGPGRVGRRRFECETGRPGGRPVFVLRPLAPIDSPRCQRSRLWPSSSAPFSSCSFWAASWPPGAG